jgi:autophagy-related protein 9
MKILIFAQELLSVVLTPFVLWMSLPVCAPAIIDFFREFSVHVDGRGYVCSFAEFNFERHGNVKVRQLSSQHFQHLTCDSLELQREFMTRR